MKNLPTPSEAMCSVRNSGGRVPGKSIPDFFGVCGAIRNGRPHFIVIRC
jgi:hypothetical protein